MTEIRTTASNSGKEIAIRLKAAEQSVQRIGGILRDLPTFFWLRAFPALKHFPSPPANH